MLGFLQDHERCNVQATGSPQLLGRASLDGQVMSSLELLLVFEFPEDGVISSLLLSLVEATVHQI